MRLMNAKWWIVAGTLAVVVVAGSIVGGDVHHVQIQADAHAKQVLVQTVAAQIAEQEALLRYDATHAVPDAAAAAKEAAADRRAAHKAAADGLAAHKAADAAAQAAAQNRNAVTIPTGPTASTTWAAGEAPKGTPLPHHTETDSNNARYGQQTYDDPRPFCAAHSRSTIDGIPVCD